MTSPADEALTLQRPLNLNDGALRIVAVGPRQDQRAEAA